MYIICIFLCLWTRLGLSAYLKPEHIKSDSFSFKWWLHSCVPLELKFLNTYVLAIGGHTTRHVDVTQTIFSIKYSRHGQRRMQAYCVGAESLVFLGNSAWSIPRAYKSPSLPFVRSLTAYNIEPLSPTQSLQISKSILCKRDEKRDMIMNSVRILWIGDSIIHACYSTVTAYSYF